MADHALEHGENHATPKDYLVILVILAVVTALEVGTYFIPWFHEHFTALFVTLSIMATVKFALVVGYYMHLRYDASFYRQVFIIPLLIAIVMTVIVVVLTATKFLL